MLRRNSKYWLTPRRQWIARLFSIFVVLLSSAPGATRAPRFPEINLTKGKTLAGHPYMGGGISVDEQRAMEREAKSYNLKLVLTRPAGTLVAPALLMIGADNGFGIEKIVPRGPWFYIRLPSGAYTILAHFDRHLVLIRNVYVREGGRATFRLRGD